MYQVMLGYMPLPITPSKIEMRINGRNDVIDLINGSQVPILKGAGLTEISFEFMLPHQAYPFASLSGSVASILPFGGTITEGGNTAILEYLEYLKTGSNTTSKLLSKDFSSLVSGVKDNRVKGVPFQFIIVRLKGGLSVGSVISGGLYTTNLKMTLEDYSIIEDADNGLDTFVSVNLKQYIPYSTKVYNEADETITKVRP